MRRIVNDALVSVAAVAALAIALVAIDERVRDRLAGAARGVSASGLGTAGAQIADVGPIVLAAAREQSLAHGPLVIFAVVAAVLFICMVRT